MTTAVFVATGKCPATVHVTDSERVEGADHRGWRSSSIEYFLRGGASREFVLGNNGRIEVTELPADAQGLTDLSANGLGAQRGPLAVDTNQSISDALAQPALPSTKEVSKSDPERGG